MSKEENFQTKHKLDWLQFPPAYGFSFPRFKVGTCTGQWMELKDCYVMIGVVNREPGNGHFDDVLQWFEYSCINNNKNLLVVECLNKALYEHLLTKRGFSQVDADKTNCVKIYCLKKYKMMMRHGNEILIKGSLRCR